METRTMFVFNHFCLILGSYFFSCAEKRLKNYLLPKEEFKKNMPSKKAKKKC